MRRNLRVFVGWVEVIKPNIDPKHKDVGWNYPVDQLY